MKIFLLILIFFLTSLFLPLLTRAQSAAECDGYHFKVPLFADDSCIDNPAELIKAAYELGLILVVALAMIMITVGGFQYLISMGNSSKMSDAKERITQALLGLILALSSWLILYIINPSLVNLRWEPSGVQKLTQETLEEIRKKASSYAFYASCDTEVKLYDQWYKITQDSTASDKQKCEKVDITDMGLSECMNEYQKPSPDFSKCGQYAKFVKPGVQPEPVFFNEQGIVEECGGYQNNRCPQLVCIGLPCMISGGTSAECKLAANLSGQLICQ